MSEGNIDERVIGKLSSKPRSRRPILARNDVNHATSETHDVLIHL